ncbi:YceI family protein [Persicobacter sp. CCB-QB2]|uniref:YceI family protein n=1 Tax=Persicobacter sp. CCB-QB2 TaxID=1561025 RepID=UPI0006A9F057|nr:YceI family protein [Persicobacter sp. CCB-QB2]
MGKAKLISSLFSVVFIVLFSASASFAEGFKITIKGVSNVHDWECEVEQADVKVTATANGGTLEALEGAKVVVPVKSIKSGKSGMDKNIYKALKESKHADIAFEMKKVNSLDGSKVSVDGTLRIAGVTNNVTLNAELTTVDGKVAIKGAEVISMKAYEVEAPTAMFGAITTEDEVTVEYVVFL